MLANLKGQAILLLLYLFVIVICLSSYAQLGKVIDNCSAILLDFVDAIDEFIAIGDDHQFEDSGGIILGLFEGEGKGVGDDFSD